MFSFCVLLIDFAFASLVVSFTYINMISIWGVAVSSYLNNFLYICKNTFPSNTVVFSSLH